MMPDAEITALAARQHALVTGEQARSAGLSEHAIQRRVRRGLRGRPRRGVFAVAGSPPTFEQAVLAAVLASGSGAVASHATAGVVWRLPFVEHEVAEVTTDRPQWARLEGVRSHRTVKFLKVEHTVRRSIPVTTVARTLVDLSARFSVAQLGCMVDHGSRHGTLRLDDLRKCVAGLPPAPGRRPSRVHALLARRLSGYDPGESDLEMRFVRWLVGGGLPEPVQQHRVVLDSRRCRTDLAYPDARLAIEIDRWDTHRSRSSFDGDRARGNAVYAALSQKPGAERGFL